MTIRQSIRDALRANGPMTVEQIAKATGHDAASIKNAKGYMTSEGYIRQAPGQKQGKGLRYELMPLPELKHGNVLKSPPWIPPKPLHRPVIHAPGMVVREFITGRTLCAN